MGYPRESKLPPAAGIAMAVWMVLCYFPMYFSPRYGYIRNGGLWVLFALLSFAPVVLFLLFAFALAKKRPKSLLAPWGLHILFTTPFPVAACLIREYYIQQYYIAENIPAQYFSPPWLPTAVTVLLSAGAMLCFRLAITGRLKSNVLPLILAVALPVWSLLCRASQWTHFFSSFLDYRPSAVIGLGLPIAYDILGALPYILLIAGLKNLPIEISKGEPT